MSDSNTLSHHIEEYRAGFTQKVPEDIREVMANATAALDASGITDQAPKVGEELSNFSLSDQNGSTVSLDELAAKGPTIITFYRGGWCPYCNLELRAYQEVLTDIHAAGGQLVAITPELPDNSLSTIEKNELGFTVLSDVNSTYAKSIGIVFSLPEELRPIYQNFGINLEAHNGEGQFDLPLAATFVIDSDKTIISAFVEADYTQRQEPNEVLSVLRDL